MLVTSVDALGMPHMGRLHAEPHDTEREAAQAIAPTAGHLCLAVFQLLHDHPDGLTDDEGGALLGRDRLTFGRRRNELAIARIVRDSGRRRLNPAGRRAIVWELTDPCTDPWKTTEAHGGSHLSPPNPRPIEAGKRTADTDTHPFTSSESEQRKGHGMSALFRRTGGDDFPDRLKCMISGSPKSGKTYLLGTVPNIVIADTEPHANNLQSVAHLNLPFVTINGSSDLQRLQFVLADDTMRAKAAEQLSMPKIEAVAIDTVDTLQQILKKERLKEVRHAEFQRDDWGWLKDELSGILRAFTALPLHVFFIIHTKTMELGKGDDARTIVLPALQGGLDEVIAGMVGYSLLSFRKEAVRPDGSKYTKYWLRCEGDETYNYLGNRAAGRLPDVIEPNFQAIYDAAMAGRKAIPPPNQPVEEAFSAQITRALTAGQSTNSATPAQVAQNTGQVTPPGNVATSNVTTLSDSPAPDGDDPVNLAALSHSKKVYDAIGLEFPEEIIKTLTMTQARSLVKMWKAIQADDVQGKNTSGKSPAEQQQDYLLAFGWVSETDKARMAGGTPPTVATPVSVVPDLEGTAKQVMAYAGDNLLTIQEAYDAELRRPRPRSSLLAALQGKGAVVPSDEPEPAPAVQEEPVAQESEPVTPATPEVDDVGANAVKLLEREFNAIQIDEDGKAQPCEQCGNEVEDRDIALLSRSRFGRWLCLTDYLAQTKQPRVSA